MDSWITGLAIAVAVVSLASSVYAVRTARRSVSPTGTGDDIPWRKNVLVLLFLAYGSLMVLFVGMLFAGLGAKEAYDLIGVPFVALIGGTLAVVKDLL